MRRPKNRQHPAAHVWLIIAASLTLAAVYVLAPTAPSLPSTAAASAIPVFSPPEGIYDHQIEIELLPPPSATGVVFTTDGSEPTATNGAAYIHPLHLGTDGPAAVAIRARAILSDGRLGPVRSASYFVGIEAHLPLLSLIIDPEDMWSKDRGIYPNALERGQAWERPAEVAYLDQDRHSGFHVPAGVRMHGGWSRYFSKKSFRLYFRQAYGISRLEYPLFPGSPVQSFKRLVLHNGGEDMATARDSWNWTLMRNQLTDRLARDLNGLTTHSRPVLLFINGAPWGIYHLRERIDDRFLADHYGIRSADLLDSPEYWKVDDLTGVVAGKRDHWDHLLAYVETHDLTDPDNYAYVQSQVDLGSFVDYNLLQIYAANTDWPRKNVNQFRSHAQGGRWRWAFWDTDFGFATSGHGRTEDDLIAGFLKGEDPSTDGRDVLLLRRLLENPAFRNRFLSRAADLLNNALAPERVIAHIDELSTELAPDMSYETTRWASASKWEASVAELRNFALRRPDLVRRHIVAGFHLDGTAVLTVEPPSTGAGTAAVNGDVVPDVPWQGVYFQGIPVQITAVPAPGHRFAGWTPSHLPQRPVITLTAASPMTIVPRFEPIDEGLPRPGDVVFAGYAGGENSHRESDWIGLRVTRPGGTDLGNWRVTDNDRKTATDEGSLIFAAHPSLTRVPQNTTILIRVPRTDDEPCPADDLDAWDKEIFVCVGNGIVEATSDPGFNLSPQDNLVLLAPGPTEAFADDVGIAFASRSAAVTPASFGVLADGVTAQP